MSKPEKLPTRAANPPAGAKPTTGAKPAGATQNLLKKAAQNDFDFRVFFAVWANLQGWKIPQLHLDVIDFLSKNENWDNGTGVLQVFRGAAKSTILGLFIVYQLVKDPTTRFLILSADSNTASKITADTTGIIARHPLAGHLRGRENTWRQDKFWVTGATDSRTASVSSFGIGSNVTGTRADWVVFDDVEVPKNCLTAMLREDLRRRISDTNYIMVPTGRRLFVGTPHNEESIYPEVINSQGASSLRVPLLIDTSGDFPFIVGKSAWPERFDDAHIQKLQLNAHSKNEFLSQVQLVPKPSDEQMFDASLLIEYKNEAEIFTSNRETVLTIGEKRMVSCSAFWDPSMGSSRSDDSVLSIVYADAAGHYYLHRCIALKGDADEQCEQAKQVALEFHLPSIIVETNGIGNFLPAILRKYLNGTGISCEGKVTTKNKALKITEAFEVPLYAGLLHIHSQVMQSKFFVQFRDFNPKTIGRDKDDYIDSTASAILNEPIRITRGLGFSADGRARWQQSQGTVDIEVEAFVF